MSVCIEITVDELADFNLLSVPPCEVNLRSISTGVVTGLCGKPSVVRLTINCHACESTKATFLCSECYADVKSGELLCGTCFTRGDRDSRAFSFREI